jgi:oligo-1,6-glucosidase/alpha-glucosidase
MKHESGTPWWKNAVFYHVYPRSFFDSNGDGIGDLNGIRQKLDYIVQLGADAVWISPFFRSPHRDFGYDVSDYREVDPIFGSNEDFDALLREAHGKGIKIVLDLVMNHTSDEHPWFKAALSRTHPYRKWYVWYDGPKPPNNWLSLVGRRAWNYRNGSYYYTAFLPFQPDLNYRNPDVQKEMLSVAGYWLEKGADGFRLDIFNCLFEDERLRNNPITWRFFPTEHNPSMFFQRPKYTLNLPESADFARKLRAAVDEYPDKFLVGEVMGTEEAAKAFCGRATENGTDGLHAVFLFKTLSTRFSARAFGKLMRSFEKHFPEPYFPTWVFSNHDRVRSITRLGENTEKAKVLATLQLTARGIPFIYYGEEIGMSQHRIPLTQAKDPLAEPWKKLPEWTLKILRKRGLSLNRDECRTPMQWDAGLNAGFSVGKPWLPVLPDYREKNVAAQEQDPLSLLNVYRRLIALRKQEEVLRTGATEIIPSPTQVLAYRRYLDNRSLSVALNFSPRPQRMPFAFKDILFSTAPMQKDILPPYGAAVFV